MSVIAAVSLIAGAYLFGAIPFGLLIGKARGVDIRQGGSGNIGATNVGRLLGRPMGYVCFVLDVAKGAMPAALAVCWTDNTVAGQWVQLAAGAAAVLGHMFSIYIGFRGGKGVATSFGVVLGLWHWFGWTVPAVLVLWALIWLMTHYISLGSIIAAISFPLLFILQVVMNDENSLSGTWPMVLFTVMIAALVVFRHRGNIARLLAGTEHRTAGLRKKTDA